jgi:hypothetical protein
MSSFAKTVLATMSVLFAATWAMAQAVPDLDKVFAQADLNHDGIVTRAEFQKSRAARFRQLDFNHDDYLSQADIPPGLNLIHPNTARIAQMLAQFDTDHDGRVSLAEFIAGSMRLFDEADTTHDGILTKAEASAATARFKAALNQGR